MIVDYLGHSEILLNIENSNWEIVKILSDTWLSDYSVADLMQRNPILNKDFDKIKPDIVFISHSHMDHLDPYSLVKLFKKHKPILLLPETLTYLKDLLQENLESEIIILKNKQTVNIKWINIQWIIFPDWMNTNEADVMTLAVWNDNEIFYTEVDIVPPDTEEWIWYIYKLFTQKNFETRLYLSTRNELEWNLTIIDLPEEDRKDFVIEYKQKRIGEMYQHYNNIFALEENGIKANIYKLPGFVRGFIGQWIIFPVLDYWCDALKLQIMPLDENVELETEIAGDFWLTYPMYSLHKFEKITARDSKLSKALDCTYLWKWRFIFENWDLKKIEKIPYVDGFYFKSKQDLSVKFKRTLKKEPILWKRKLDEKEELNKVLNYLNTRFYHYQHGRIDANLKNLALENDGKYTICLIWDKKYFLTWELGSNWFSISDNEEDYQEIYYLQDIVDFIDWNIELYSNFWSYLEPWTNIYLWECLWANFINNDIVLRKFKKHFNLAKNWLTPSEFVRKILPR